MGGLQSVGFNVQMDGMSIIREYSLWKMVLYVLA